MAAGSSLNTEINRQRDILENQVSFFNDAYTGIMRNNSSVSGEEWMPINSKNGNITESGPNMTGVRLQADETGRYAPSSTVLRPEIVPGQIVSPHTGEESRIERARDNGGFTNGGPRNVASRLSFLLAVDAYLDGATAAANDGNKDEATELLKRSQELLNILPDIQFPAGGLGT
jgi:hypothetical protein